MHANAMIVAGRTGVCMTEIILAKTIRLPNAARGKWSAWQEFTIRKKRVVTKISRPPLFLERLWCLVDSGAGEVSCNTNGCPDDASADAEDCNRRSTADGAELPCLAATGGRHANNGAQASANPQTDQG